MKNMDEEIDPQEIIPDQQESPSADPLGSSSSIGVDHPSMSEYLEFMKDMPRRSTDGGPSDDKSGFLGEGGSALLSGAAESRDRMEPSAGSDPLNGADSGYSQDYGTTMYRPALSQHADTPLPSLAVPRYSTRSAGYPQYDAWASPFNQDGSMALNSSGEENKLSSPDEFGRLQEGVGGGGGGGGAPAGAYYGGSSPGFRPQHQMGTIIGPLDSIGCMPVCPGRETHNEKERKRRYRIKNACSLLKDLVPGLSDKTDKATVLEYTVQYLIHLKKHVGRQFDKDFMEKYSPY